MLHHLRLDWATGTVNRIETVFLTDPDRKAPFPIAMEGAATRYLTGADFDVESIQPVADGFWVGEEFGPFILKFSRAGVLTDVIPTLLDGKPVASPDNATLTLQADPSKPVPSFNLKRSGGYEGLALSPDGSKLYGLLEGPIWTDSETVEQADGRPRFAFSNSTLPPRPGPAAAGSTRSPRAARRSATSTCSTTRPPW